MGYRIRYATLKKSQRQEKSRSMEQTMLAAGLFLLLFLGCFFLNRYPAERDYTQTQWGQILVERYREMLIGAGYEG